MEKPAWLYVDILETKGQHRKIRGKLFDGTEFHLGVRKWSVDPIIPADTPIIIGEEKQGWLSVIYHGQQDQKASVTLPEHILELGNKITVQAGQIKLAD